MSNLREAFFESLESPKLVARKLWLCRYPILFSTFLILIGPIGVLKAEIIFGNGFLICNVKQMVAITAMTLVSATLLLKQMLLVFLRAHERFDDIRQPTAVPGAWNWLQTSFLLIAGFSMPLTCWIHSMHEAGGDFIDDPPFSFEKGMAGLMLGLLVYFFLILLSAAIQYALEPKQEDRPVLSMPLLENIRRGLSFRFKRVKKFFQEGHFELFMDFLTLMFFYLVLYACNLGREFTPEDMFTSPFYLILK